MIDPIHDVTQEDLQEAVHFFLTKKAHYYGDGKHEPILLDIEMSHLGSNYVTKEPHTEEAFGILGAVVEQPCDHPKILVIGILEKQDFTNTKPSVCDPDESLSLYFAFSRAEAKRTLKAIKTLWPEMEDEL